MATRKFARLKAEAEEELRTLYVCEEALIQQQQLCFSGAGEALLWQLATDASPDEDAAGAHFEAQQHMRHPGLFGPRLPRTKQRHVTERQLHALLVSHLSRKPGFQHLLKFRTTEGQADKQPLQAAAAASPPLLRLLRRVCLWYYYRVMFDPLHQLLALTSGCELLFQLMTPHQQLSCMADILLVLACPMIADSCGDLDTPLHTATLLSMLKMAQQMAVSEAAVSRLLLQIRERQALTAAGQLQEPQVSQVDAALQARLQHSVGAAAEFLAPPAPSVLARATSSGQPAQLRDSHPQLHSLLEQLQATAQQQHSGRWRMVATHRGLASLVESSACQAVGAVLALVSQFPPKQFQQWLYSTLPDSIHLPRLSTTTAAAQWLQRCCGALQAREQFGLDDSSQADPVLQLVLWVMKAMNQPQQQQQRQQQQQAQPQPGVEQQEQPQPPQHQHPAEVLRQLLDVLLSALQYRHMLETRQRKLPEVTSMTQRQLLRVLHCHCMQLLAQAREQLPPAACSVGSSSHAGSGGGPSGNQQQQQQAWQQCVLQVQHNLLLVVQLTRQWQEETGTELWVDTFTDLHARGVPGFIHDFSAGSSQQPHPFSMQQQPLAQTPDWHQINAAAQGMLKQLGQVLNIEVPQDTMEAAEVVRRRLADRDSGLLQPSGMSPLLTPQQRLTLQQLLSPQQQQLLSPLQLSPQQQQLSSQQLSPLQQQLSPQQLSPLQLSPQQLSPQQLSPQQQQHLLEVAHSPQLQAVLAREAAASELRQPRGPLSQQSSQLPTDMQRLHQAVCHEARQLHQQRHNTELPAAYEDAEATWRDAAASVLRSTARVSASAAATAAEPAAQAPAAAAAAAAAAGEPPKYSGLSRGFFSPPRKQGGSQPPPAAAAAAAEAASTIPGGASSSSGSTERGGGVGSPVAAAEAALLRQATLVKAGQQLFMCGAESAAALGSAALPEMLSSSLQLLGLSDSPQGARQLSLVAQDVALTVTELAGQPATATPQGRQQQPLPLPPEFEQREPLVRKLLLLTGVRGCLADEVVAHWQSPAHLQFTQFVQQHEQQQQQQHRSSLPQQRSSPPSTAAPAAAPAVSAAAAAAVAGVLGSPPGYDARLYGGGRGLDWDADPGFDLPAVLRMKGGMGGSSSGSSSAAASDLGAPCGSDDDANDCCQRQQRHGASPAASVLRLRGGRGGSSSAASSDDGTASEGEQQLAQVPQHLLPRLRARQQQVGRQHQHQQQQQQQQRGAMTVVKVRSDDDSSSGADSPTASAAGVLQQQQQQMGGSVQHRSTAEDEQVFFSEEEEEEEDLLYWWQQPGPLSESEMANLQETSRQAAAALAQSDALLQQQQQQPVRMSARQALAGPRRWLRRDAGAAAASGGPDAAASSSGDESEDESDAGGEGGLAGSPSAPQQLPKGFRGWSGLLAADRLASGRFFQQQQQEGAQQGSSGSSGSSGSGGSSTYLEAGFAIDLDAATEAWAKRLQQQQQQRPPPQQQQQQLSPADVQSFQPSQQPGHLLQVAGSKGVEGVMPWVELLMAAACSSPAVRAAVLELLSTVGKLGCPSIWHPQAEAEEEAFASGIVREAAGHPQLLAFLTLLLVSEDVKALFLFPEDGPIAVQATRQLWAAVDCAFSTVVYEVNSLPGHLESWSATVQRDVLEPLKKAQEDWGSPNTKLLPAGQQGFGAVVKAAEAWTKLLSYQLRRLGPVHLFEFDPDNVPDELVNAPADQAASKLEAWRLGFESTLDWIKQLTQLEVWLAHVGHIMQAKHRLLRRTARVLAAAQGDPVLAGLHQHVSASSLPQLNAALAAAVQTHEQLGAAFREGIADGGFGVIWRAFRLMCRLWRTKMTFAEHVTPHHHVSEALKRLVMGPICRYITSASPYMLEAALAMGADMSQASDRCWMKMILLFAMLRCVRQRFWWMLVPADRKDEGCDKKDEGRDKKSEGRDTEGEGRVSDRAAGRLLVQHLPAFSSSNRRGSKAGGASASSADAAQQQQLRRRRPLKAPPGWAAQQHEVAAAGDNSGSDSDGAGASGEALWQGFDRLAAYEQLRPSDSSISTSGQYGSWEDPAAALPSLQAALLAAAYLQDFAAAKRDLQQLQPDMQQPQEALADLEEHAAACERDWQAAASTCHSLVSRDPFSGGRQGWDFVCEWSLAAPPLPPGSVSTASVSGSSSGPDSDSETHEDQQQQPPARQAEQRLSTAAARGLAAAAAGNLQQKRARRRQREALLRYGWDGCRPWQVPRAALLVRRQWRLTWALQLQDFAADKVQQAQRALFTASAATAISADRQQQQQLQDVRLSWPSSSGLVAAAAGLLSRGAGGSQLQRAAMHITRAMASFVGARLRDSSSSGSGMEDVLLLQLQPQAAPDSGQDVVPDACKELLRLGRVDVVAAPSSAQQQELRSEVGWHVEQQRQLDAVLDVCGWGCGTTAASRPDGVSLSFVLLCQQLPAAEAAGNTTRQLLWDLLGQVKPAACPWYEAAAQHHLQRMKEQKQLMQDGDESVPACTSRALWSTLTASLAADLLLVPPSIRDMVGNNWAAGAGRLAGPGTDSSSSSGGSDCGIAARMLAVQYVRAARRQFAQAYQVPAFVGQLLSLQLLADEDELLSELQPGSAGQAHAALATHSAAAAAGMLPTDALAACLATAGSSTPASGSAAAAAGRQAGNAASSGSSGGCAAGSSSGQAACGCCFRPTLAQLAAQAGAVCGAPADTLPWLQLLSRYHTLAAQVSEEQFGLDQKVKDGAAAAAALAAQALTQFHRIVALAGALGSLGAQLPPLLAAVAQAASDTHKHPASNAAALLATLLPQLPQQQQQQRQASVLASACLQQQNPQPSQQQQDRSFESVGHWVHAERLLRVTPSTWHAHLAEHLLQTPGSSSSGSNAAAVAAAAAAASHQKVDRNVLHLLADAACDWCGEPLPQQPGGSGPGSSSGGGSSAGSEQQQPLRAFGCISCGAAQYCSKGCRDAAKTVHAANCWRLQALARDGLCWQRPAYQRPASSSTCRSFWDLSAVQQQQQQAEVEAA